MSAEQIWGIVRTIVAAGAGYVGIDAVQDAEWLNAMLGAAGTLFVGIWSWMAKRNAT